MNEENECWEENNNKKRVTREREQETGKGKESEKFILEFKMRVKRTLEHGR